MRSLFAPLVPLAVGAFLACSAGKDTDNPGGFADAGRDTAGDGGLNVDGSTLCNVCAGNTYLPCEGDAIVCEGSACVPGKGCLACVPNETTCVGNDVFSCTADGTVGSKKLTCDPGKGEVCFKGACKAACDVAADQPSNVGCEFWAVDLDNGKDPTSDAKYAPWGVVIANAGDLTANIVIEINDAKPGAPLALKNVKTFTLKPGTLEKVILPQREVDGATAVGKDDGPGTFLSSNAFRITSTAPLVVYQFNAMEQIFSNDASLLIPRNGLGTQYRVLGWPTANPIAPIPIPGVPDHSYVTILGTEPNTKVTVTLSHKIVAGGGIKATPKGGKVEAILGPFDVLNLETEGIPGDLTGSIVESSAPIAVFTGGERAIVPGTPAPPGPPGFESKDLCCTDHLEEQLFPVSSLGKRFVVTRSPIRSKKGYIEPDIIRVLGVAATANVKTNLPPPFDSFTVKPGEFKELWADRDAIFEASEPITIGQFLVSQAFCDTYSGDPSLTIFPPVEQHRSEYLFLVPPSWNRNEVVIGMPAGTKVTIDGAPLAGCVEAEAGELAGVMYAVRRCPIKEGPHRLSGDKPFGIVAYGYGPAGSYAFAGGADVKRIYEPPPLK